MAGDKVRMTRIYVSDLSSTIPLVTCAKIDAIYLRYQILNKFGCWHHCLLKEVAHNGEELFFQSWIALKVLIDARLVAITETSMAAYRFG